ncbi:hypothetical protein CK203_029506 [Vitis vinifera]|uniref:Endonuclease/exonuclease/phosphatase domain-containing protein n=1 Tax=Vitis vinifera TaxID=29760 RepID=A0A438JC82_VITVI|nr:hypothetical protein CK203_029506 [Vitis vinifera]
MPTKGFGSEILKLLNRMRERRDRSEMVSGKKRKGQRPSRFDRELKKLEWPGVKDRDKRKLIKDVIKTQKVDLVCLWETKIQETTSGIVRSLGVGRYLEWGALNSRGAPRRVVVVFWDNRVLQLVEMEVGGKRNFFSEMRAIRGLWNEPWCVAGDFNMIRFPSEHSRGGRPSPTMRRFSEVIKDLELRDLPLQGGLFTWSGGAIQVVLARPLSDHSPILLDGGGVRRGSTPFRFENMWLKEEGFKEVLRKWWEGIQVSGSASFILIEKLKALKPILRSWNKEVFGQIDSKKQNAWNLLDFRDKEESVRSLSLEEEEARKEA